MSILIKDLPLAGYEISIMKDGERYRARVDGIWCEVEEIPTTEPDTDTISRQAAIDALKEHRALYCDNTPDAFSKLSHAEKSRVDELDTAIATLVNLPPIQPKRGRWIGKYPVTSVCSECGFLIHDSKVKVFAFCPNCGADMRGEHDG